MKSISLILIPLVFYNCSFSRQNSANKISTTTVPNHNFSEQCLPLLDEKCHLVLNDTFHQVEGYSMFVNTHFKGDSLFVVKDGMISNIEEQYIIFKKNDSVIAKTKLPFYAPMCNSKENKNRIYNTNNTQRYIINMASTGNLGSDHIYSLYASDFSNASLEYYFTYSTEGKCLYYIVCNKIECDTILQAYKIKENIFMEKTDTTIALSLFKYSGYPTFR